MLDTSARLLRLLVLLQTRALWSGRDLAERLEITERSVRRDIDRLRELGYPVHASPGVGGGYRLGAGKALPPLLLDDDEAVAVAVSLRTAAGGTVAGIGESSARALAKLDQVLPPRLRGQVSAVGDATVAMEAGTPAIDPDTMMLLARACRDGERVRFDYADNRGRDSHRRVEPHRLVSTGRRWYLVARDVDRDDWRTFRVDRLHWPVATGQLFELDDPPDAAAMVTRGVAWAAYPYRARVRLFSPVDVVSERVPPSTGVLEPLDDQTCELTTGANSLHAIALELVMLGCDFEIREPPELADVVAAIGHRLLQAAAGIRGR